MSIVPATATLDDLYSVDGKAELIAGRIVTFMPSGHAPSRAAFKIAIGLEAYAQKSHSGIAYSDGVGYALKRPLVNGRQSFSPDAFFHTGSPPRNRMRFVEGVPALAVEVRSEGDYGEGADARLAAKRADYFEAGTQVVWDVDPLARTVAAYRTSAPDRMTLYTAGQIADAEPALPGWRLPVDEIFE